MGELNKKYRPVVASFALFAVVFVLLGYGAIVNDRIATLGGKLLFAFLWIPLGGVLLLDWKTTPFTVVTAVCWH